MTAALFKYNFKKNNKFKKKKPFIRLNMTEFLQKFVYSLGKKY